MTVRPRLALAATTTAAAVAALLAGCATSAATGGVAEPSTSRSAVSAAPSRATASPTTSVPPTSAAPTASGAPTPTRSTAPTPTPTAAALAQHVHDLCRTGAADAGVTLTFTEDPSGYTGSDGRYHLVYPFTFDDGHEDPWAIWNCTLSDDTVDSTFVGSGISDTH